MSWPSLTVCVYCQMLNYYFDSCSHYRMLYGCTMVVVLAKRVINLQTILRAYMSNVMNDFRVFIVLTGFIVYVETTSIT